jgi:hypothetical protein
MIVSTRRVMLASAGSSEPWARVRIVIVDAEVDGRAIEHEAAAVSFHGLGFGELVATQGGQKPGLHDNRPCPAARRKCREATVRRRVPAGWQRAGKVLADGQCYAFTTLPIFGGDYSVENVWVAPWGSGSPSPLTSSNR